MGLIFSAPHMKGNVEDIGVQWASEATSNLLSIVESRTAHSLVALLGVYTVYKIAVGLHQEFGTKPPIEHEVRRRDDRSSSL